MKIYDVAIIGSGIMGASAAYELARRGASVALIDQAALPNPQGASVDYSKIFRFAYPDPLYVQMAVEALELWRKLEEESATHLLDETGLLLIGNRADAFETHTYEALHSLNLKAEMLSGEEVITRFPQFNKETIAFAVLDPSGGILYADKAVQAAINLARKFGTTIFENQRISAIERQVNHKLIRSESGQEWACKKVLIAAGPWTRKLLPDFASLLTTTQQEVVYFEPVKEVEKSLNASKTNFIIGEFPIFIEIDSGFYGFPIHHNGAMKTGNHLQGKPIDPYNFNEKVDEEFIERCRKFFARTIPALADARVAKSHICIYNNSPDEDFIIDWHPDFDEVLLATGFSGHGFKFGPLIGRIVAELLLDRKSNYQLDRFRLLRFQK
jgi:N-methyl-L-tryptophan oxidase